MSLTEYEPSPCDVPGAKPDDDASGDSDHAEHQRHRARELLAIARALFEEKRGQRVRRARDVLVVVSTPR